jgi:hypothetical protein
MNYMIFTQWLFTYKKSLTWTNQWISCSCQKYSNQLSMDFSVMTCVSILNHFHDIYKKYISSKAWRHTIATEKHILWHVALKTKQYTGIF